MNRPMKVLVFVSGLILCLILAVLVWPQFGVRLLIVGGRAPDCTMRGALAAMQRQYLYKSAAHLMQKQSRINRREKDDYVLMETPFGSFWEPYNSRGSVTLAQIAEIQSKYAENAPNPVNEGDIVLDCGANIGVFTRDALKRGAKLVVAIEPVPQNLECIRRNLREPIASGQVIVYPKGVWNKDDVLIFNESDQNLAEGSFIRTDKTHPGTELPLTTIDKLVGELKLDRVDFIKMDIEGAEVKALVGAQLTLGRFKPRLEVESSGNAKEILNVARRAWPGFKLECLTCNLDSDRMIIYPSLVNLFP